MKKNICFLIIILFAIFVSFSSYAETPPELFHDKDTPGFSAERKAYHSDAIKKVSVDFSLINPEGSRSRRIIADLPDKSVTLEMTNISSDGNGNYSWFGKVEGKKLSSVVFSVTDGKLFGDISVDGESYAVEPSGKSYRIVREDLEKMNPLCDSPLIPPATHISTEEISPRKSYRDSGNEIDVLVLYTKSLKKKYKSKLNGLVKHYADIANQAYANSNINLKLNITATEAFYDDGTKEKANSTSDALTYITENATVKSLRKSYKADLICLMRKFRKKGKSPCGTGWLLTSADKTFSPYAYSVVEVRKPSGRGYYCDKRTFAHEIGHNLGCAHDRAHASEQGAYEYSYGYKKKGKFSTIMSYGSHRITYFSTPIETYRNKVIGKDINENKPAYNALTIEQTKDAVANFKKSGN